MKTQTERDSDAPLLLLLLLLRPLGMMGKNPHCPLLLLHWPLLHLILRSLHQSPIQCNRVRDRLIPAWRNGQWDQTSQNTFELIRVNVSTSLNSSGQVRTLFGLCPLVWTRLNPSLNLFGADWVWGGLRPTKSLVLVRTRLRCRWLSTWIYCR